MIIQIAGVNILIESKYQYVKWLCRDYIINSDFFDFAVSVNQKEIENMQNQEQNLPEGVCEGFAIFDKLTLRMLEYDALFVHSAVISVDGHAYAFTADSGIGKSTHILEWKKYFGERALIVNGDKPFFRRKDGQLYACGNPWCGKEGFQTNVMVPLKSLCFIERGSRNEIERLANREIINRIFSQMRLPEEADYVQKFLELVDWMLLHIPCYLLKCDISEEAVRTSYEGMQNPVMER